MQNLQQNKNWEGTAEALAEEAKRWLIMKNIGQYDFEPNERLVRDYVARGILSKPERRGKEAIFGFEQLVQFLLCRAMLDDGWPLSKISEDFRYNKLQDMIGLIPGENAADESMQLIEEFKSASSDFVALDADIPSGAKSSNKQMSSLNLNMSGTDSFVSRQRRSYEYKSEAGRDFKESLRRINSDLPNLIKIEFTALQLATWLTLLIDKDRLESITLDEAEAVGRAVTAALLSRDALTKHDVSRLGKATADQVDRINREEARFQVLRDELEKAQITLKETEIRRQEEEARLSEITDLVMHKREEAESLYREIEIQRMKYEK